MIGGEDEGGEMIRIMDYGVVRFIEGFEGLNDDSMGAHRYYNTLLAIWLEERRAWIATRRKYAPGLDDLESELKAIKVSIQELSDKTKIARKAATAEKTSKARGGKKARGVLLEMPEPDKKALDELKARRRDISEKLKPIREAYLQLLEPTEIEFETRTTGASRDVVVERRLAAADAKKNKTEAEVTEAKRHLDELNNVIKETSPANAALRDRRIQVIGEMLEEDWHPAWKEVANAQRQKMLSTQHACAEAKVSSETKESVKMSVEQAFKASKGEPRFRSFKRLQIGRKVGIRLSISGSEFTEGTAKNLRVVSSRSRMGRRDESKRIEPKADSRRSRYQFARVSMDPSKGQKGGYPPIVFDAVIDRPIPADCTIKYAYLVPKRVGSKFSWKLQLTIDIETPLIKEQCGIGNCDVSLRWSHPDGDKSRLVVAELNGEAFELDSAEYWGSIDMKPPTPGKARSRLSRAAGDKKSVVGGIGFAQWDRKFAAIAWSNKDLTGARDRLLAWIDTKLNEGKELPGWLLTEVRQQAADKERGERGHGSLEQTRHPERTREIVKRLAVEMVGENELAALWKAWRQHKKEGKIGDLYPDNLSLIHGWLEESGVTDGDKRFAIELDWWRRKNIHVLDYAAQRDSKARATRKQQYRWKARQLSAQYETVTLSKIDLRRMASKKYLEGDAENHLREQRALACPSELVEALKQAFGKARYRERSDDAPKPGGARNSME